MINLREIFFLLLTLYSVQSTSPLNTSQNTQLTTIPTGNDGVTVKSEETAIPIIDPSNLNKVNELVVRRQDVVNDLKLFDTCNPVCTNGGICRLNATTKQPQCLCPLDFAGKACETNAVPPLTTCTESTCQNGGTCAGTREKPFCSCPAGVNGSTCERRSRSYEVMMQLMLQGKPMEWTDSFTNSSNPLYIQMAQKVLHLLQLAALMGDDPLLVRTYQECAFNRFINGSVFASVYVKFDLNDSMAKNYSEQLVAEHLLTGGRHLIDSRLPASFESLTTFERGDTTAFSVRATDPCASGNHDCSANAVCLSLGNGVYTCECKTFTMDVSPNAYYPGRRCIYDGLIILTFVVVGCILSMLIFVICGCRRTIWYRYRNRREPEHVTLVKMAANYDI